MKKIPKRLFVAVEIPEQIRETIFLEISQKLPAGKMSLVKKENLHLTLCFLGYLNEKEEKKVVDALMEIKMMAFEIGFFGFSHFDKRVLFIEVTKGKKELEEISKALSGKTPYCKGEFHAHLTIARNKDLSGKEFESVLEGLSKTGFQAGFLATEIKLFESRISSDGPKYFLVHEKKLG